MENENKKNKLPIIFLILKIIGLGLIIGGIIVLILMRKSFGGGMFPGLPMIGFGLVITLWGFIPNINKLSIKTTKYLQEENKEDLTDIASTSADILSEGVTKTTKAVKKGLKDTMYCKHCGSEIDVDSKFCKHCGKSQE